MVLQRVEKIHYIHVPKHLLVADLDKALSGFVREIGQVSAVNADADGTVAELIERQRHSAEVKQPTPATDKHLLIASIEYVLPILPSTFG